jgi:hypothetical protein
MLETQGVEGRHGIINGVQPSCSREPGRSHRTP